MLGLKLAHIIDAENTDDQEAKAFKDQNRKEAVTEWIDARFMGPTWGPPGSYRPQMGPMLAPWTLLSRYAATAAHTLSSKRQLASLLSSISLLLSHTFNPSSKSFSLQQTSLIFRMPSLISRLLNFSCLAAASDNIFPLSMAALHPDTPYWWPPPPTAHDNIVFTFPL